MWTDSSKTVFLGSGTTNTSGVAVVGIARRSSMYYEASHPRFSGAASGTGAPVNATLSVGAAMTTPATGYHCSPVCAIPLADTLYYSDAMNGTVALTYGAGVWSGSTTTAFPASVPGGRLAGCVAQSLTVNFTFKLGSIYISYNHTTNNCATCPGGANTPVCFAIPNGNSCPDTGFSASFLWTAGYINPSSFTDYTGTLTE